MQFTLPEGEGAVPWPTVSFVNLCRKMSLGFTFRGIVCGGILLGLSTGAFADGTYQRTKDGKTIVWNDNPTLGDSATWTGDRDPDGYGSGFGTLTWYSRRAQEGKESLYAYYFGNMVRGKFNGPVNGHSKGVTAHAVFKQGKRATRWAAGPVSSWTGPRPGGEPSPTQAVAVNGESPNTFNSPSSNPTLTAAERPKPDYNNLRGEPSPAVEDVPAEGPISVPNRVSNAPTTESGNKPKTEVDQSLRLLAGPPPSLRTEAAPAAARASQQSGAGSAGEPNLTKEEVVALADAEAQKRGYQLGDYHRSDPLFDSTDGTWSLVYEGKPVDGPGQPNKRFTVAIDDGDKRMVIVPRR